jgi:hypothetical protein
LSRFTPNIAPMPQHVASTFELSSHQQLPRCLILSPSYTAICDFHSEDRSATTHEASICDLSFLSAAHYTISVLRCTVSHSVSPTILANLSVVYMYALTSRTLARAENKLSQRLSMNDRVTSQATNALPDYRLYQLQEPMSLFSLPTNQPCPHQQQFIIKSVSALCR